MGSDRRPALGDGRPLVSAIAAREVIFGAVSGGSLFGLLLVGGALLGGLGGFLALARAPSPAPVEPAA